MHSKMLSPDGIDTVGFVGLGVMGEPMCQNLARKTEATVIAYDRQAEPLQRLAADNVEAASTLIDLADRCNIILLSLPDGKAVEAVCLGDDGLIAHMHRGSILVDMSTSPVDMTRKLAETCRQHGLGFADAPVARTREAAIRGDLSIMVGSSTEVFSRIDPLLSLMGTEINHCGDAGCGQMVKILNNMMLFQNVCALAEALSIARHNGLDESVLLNVVSKGSGDSFALRNHATKSMLPREFPTRAFSTNYASKDLSYALALAENAGIDARSAKLVMERFEAAQRAGYGDEYFPAVLKVIDPD